MNTATVIPFRKPQEEQQEVKGMYSDRFKNGYVMSSRLYREEVRPFLSDAARNVYAELEDRINGHNKESDFVSWTQLQAGQHIDSRKMSLSTVKIGLAMLLANEIVSIVGIGRQGIKKYTINEVSLVGKKVIKPTEKEASNYFGNSSTSETVVLQKPKQTTLETVAKYFGNRSATTSEIGDTIDSFLEEDLLEEREKAHDEKFVVQKNRPVNFIEFYSKDRVHVSFQNLFKKYPQAQINFIDQAIECYPNHSQPRIIENLRKMAQWSLDKSNHTPQKWMTIWLDTFMAKLPTDAMVQAEQDRKAKKSNTQQISTEKPKRVSRFGKYLKPQQPQQGEIRDV